MNFDFVLAAEGRDKGGIVAGNLFASLDGIGHFADTVDDGQDRSDERGIRFTATCAAFCQRVLGGVAQFLELGEVEEAAVAFDRMDEAEDRIDPLLVGRIGLPGDELSAALLEHFARFGDKVCQQLIHGLCGSPVLRGPLWPMMVNDWFGLSVLYPDRRAEPARRS